MPVVYVYLLDGRHYNLFGLCDGIEPMNRCKWETRSEMVRRWFPKGGGMRTTLHRVCKREIE